ncbi:hypothetical protein THASP1DRAFT_14334 [Thamnocephalis sphaerospora]|uniref:non-specific serine/threonine protein kinase n=1 Tax=Thamnocephalis sphaerospora TaxID=78915 RepID=A0A4P9XT97_9FUNG|nr:hypothetical protein THASP1DRAFT_14334 [Thamnocephalis sphaerospora]|eukprot:RKP09385.1 hypothetical protein THASP1DRAFT_14334 [Thamnocephalis sphaerospora]
MKEFRAARDAISQGHIAYTLQSILRYCGVPACSGMADAQHEFFSATESQSFWDLLLPDTQRALSPFRSSRYSVSLRVPSEPARPIYAHQPSYDSWLRVWAHSLRKTIPTRRIRKLFGACKSAIASEDGAVAEYMLPHLVLNGLLECDEATKNAIIDEVLAVLLDVKHWEVDSEKRRRCIETMASIVERLLGWIKQQKQRAVLRTSAGQSRGRSLDDGQPGLTSGEISALERLLAAIPSDLLAEAAFHCKAYARALLHYEQYIREQRVRRSASDMLPLYQRLQVMYAYMDEPDGVRGISTKFEVKSLDQQIFEHETAGSWIGAQTCYELVLQSGRADLSTHLGYINTLKQLGRLGRCRTKRRICWRNPDSYLISAAWSLQRWEDLDQLLRENYDQSFDSDVGLILAAARQNNVPLLESRLSKARENLFSPLATACAESYRRAYHQILQLHMLYELEACLCPLSGTQNGAQHVVPSGQQLADAALWDARLRVTMPTFKTREPILRLRRTIDGLLCCLGNTAVWSDSALWVQTSQLARKTGMLETAHAAALHASQLGAPAATVQLAKLYWQDGRRQQAVRLVTAAAENNRGLQEQRCDSADHQRHMLPTYLCTICAHDHVYVSAQVDVLRMRWIEETGSTNSNTLIIKYQEVTPCWPAYSYEAAFFYCGWYYNKLIDSQKLRDGTGLASHGRRSLTAIAHACKYYARSLAIGSRHIYQSLPKMLTLWLDLGSESTTAKEQSRPGSRADTQSGTAAHLHSLNRMMKKLAEKIAPYQVALRSAPYLVAFSQVVSRICHTNSEVLDILEQIILRVLQEYPQQALWNLVAVSKSTYKTRSSRCASILRKAQVGGQTARVFTASAPFIALTDELLVLANHRARRDKPLSLARDFPRLQQLVPLPVIVPLQSSLTVALPDKGMRRGGYQAFPDGLPTISGFCDDIEVMPSMQLPRKITAVGSDGQHYIFLCKPKDDLRKDARLMEFNAMINRLLIKDSESRKRRLHIRTYAVVPLNETCGLIEWVNNTVGYRHILLKIYKSKGIPILSHAEVRDMLSMSNAPQEEVFVKNILPRFPSVFHEWFLDMFPDPMQWFINRLNYATSAAVMSMVGFMVGLGDRHGENILFDEETGDCVHVDFNCLFEKGMTLEVPECVPFRLTHNMVDALGVVGYEGVFRTTCETATRVLRENAESLMSVLEAFIHDPLVEWNKSAVASGDVVNARAKKSLARIHEKLHGAAHGGLPLSVEGHVDELIEQATDTKHLARMYVGWAPHM